MKLLRTDGSLIIEREGTIKEVVEYCVKNNISLLSANLQGVNLRDANLRGADLLSANLQGANLQGANLRGADLLSANLQGAYMQGANLRGADLQDADLLDSDLRGANLRGVNLRDAKLLGTKLRRSKNIILFNKLDGRTCYAVNHGDELMIHACCFWGTLRRFEKACKDKYPNDPIQAYEAQITYLKILQSKIK